jgi:hypothetical protein
MNQMMPFESLLERDAFLLFEFSPGVIEYKAQPEKIYFQQDNKQRLYFPDVRIDLVNGEYLHVEVKPKSKLKNQILVQRLNAIHLHYKETEASGFMVFDESVIRREPLLTNLKLLAYHLPRKHIQEDVEIWLQKLSILPSSTVRGAACVLGDIRNVYCLIALGHYECDLNLPLTESTEIWPAKGGDHHDAILF